MNNEHGAGNSCASFTVTVKGYAGSYGAAKACAGAKMPSSVREHTWKRLSAWADKTLERYKGKNAVPGIHTLLWNIGEEGMGFRIVLRDIPLEQEAVEIAEALGLDIYELESADIELKLCSERPADDFTVIGYASPGRDKKIYNGSGESCLNRPGE